MMNKDYKISNDGTIFEINEDGSISKVAKIDDNGNISSISAALNRQENSGKGKYYFFIILFLVAAVILGILYSQTSDDLSFYKWRYHETDGMLSEVHEELKNTKSIISDIAETYPLLITDIEIANVYFDGDIQTNYGNTIYSSETMYLQPRIKYKGLISGNKTIKIKWYGPDGTIISGTSSPIGFSQSQSIYVNLGDNKTQILSGWGYSSKGFWRKGSYRIEIWYENSCLKSRMFTIY